MDVVPPAAGMRLRVWWHALQEYHECVVLDWRVVFETNDHKKSFGYRHRCQYSGGVVEHNLAETSFELIPSSSVLVAPVMPLRAPGFTTQFGTHLPPPPVPLHVRQRLAKQIKVPSPRQSPRRSACASPRVSLRQTPRQTAHRQHRSRHCSSTQQVEPSPAKDAALRVALQKANERKRRMNKVVNKLTIAKRVLCTKDLLLASLSPLRISSPRASPRKLQSSPALLRSSTKAPADAFVCRIKNGSGRKADAKGLMTSVRESVYHF